MPPANSPAESTSSAHLAPAAPSPRRSPSPTTLLPVLRDLASPVLDLASTLTIEAEDDIDEDNVSFLRRPMDHSMNSDTSLQDARQQAVRRRQETHRQRERTQNDLQRLAEEEMRERRLHQRRMAQLRAQMDPRVSSADRNRSHSPYSGHVPHQQSLFDWAPAAHTPTPGDVDAQDAEAVRVRLPVDRRPDYELQLALLEVQNRRRVMLAEAGSASTTRRESASGSERSTSDRFGMHAGDAGPTSSTTMSPEHHLALPEAQNRERMRSDTASMTPSGHDSSLRSAVLIQSARRTHRLGARSRDLMHRFMLDRERGEAAATEVPPVDESASAPTSMLDIPLPEFVEFARSRAQNADRTSRYLQPRNRFGNPGQAQRPPDAAENLRRLYLDDPADRSTRFERAIRILYWIQAPNREVEDLDELELNAKDKESTSKFVRREFFRAMRGGVGPAYTSWLVPGATFLGSQSAAPLTSTNQYRRANGQTAATVESRDSLEFSPTRTQIDPSRPWFNHIHSSSPPSPGPVCCSPNRWTVKVEIHGIDWDKMTLQGTMEAFDVPSMTQGPMNRRASQSQDQSSSTKATFSTFLEGELIDFYRHTLLTDTETFKATKATPSTDALYWRKLEPFASMHDEEIFNCLANPDWIRDELNGKYILMRWKERCFVKETVSQSGSEHASAPPPFSHTGESMSTSPVILHNADGNGYGLSISGFYYLCLRRSDGLLQGLYYDPQNTPYQHLEMQPMLGMRMGAETWEFR